MNRDKNWEGFTNIGHANWTGITPSKSSGGYAPNSERIPPVAWLGTAVVVAVFFGFAYIGFGAGF